MPISIKSLSLGTDAYPLISKNVLKAQKDLLKNRGITNKQR
ncbi:hypothetical protein [Methanomethylovorans sp.]|nr:hypothetical protein [Methanomethylovorans sp.]